MVQCQDRRPDEEKRPWVDHLIGVPVLQSWYQYLFKRQVCTVLPGAPGYMKEVLHPQAYGHEKSSHHEVLIESNMVNV